MIFPVERKMIDNPQVNADLMDRGFSSAGYAWQPGQLPSNHSPCKDVVIIPAFGIRLTIEETKSIGIPTKKYNTTCPFVEKVWNPECRSPGNLHDTAPLFTANPPMRRPGPPPHAAASAPTIIVKDMEETVLLGDTPAGRRTWIPFDKASIAGYRYLMPQKT